ncbi:bile acid:sodium symporter family protein [Sphingobium sp. MK2]|uniref:bile acid:sodium symporter family protein n=1 Tax=Sphingobium sp. MK2 TaxID=3116540 RepID=UPI0032E36747
MKHILKLLPFDGYSLALIGTVVLAALMPIQAGWASAFSVLTTMAIALLFFLHGARLARETVIAGITHWRLHLLVLLCTFVLFPLLAMIMRPIVAGLLSPLLATGFLFIALLPSTVQSSIAFTSIARGNVTAAICSAAASNLIGTLLTPALVALFMGIQTHGGDTMAVMRAIMLQLLVPFVAGQLLRPALSGFIARNKQFVTMVDRGSILMVVYGAFSAAVLEGLFRRISVADFGLIFLFSTILLAAVMTISLMVAKKFGFSREDRITILFCGSKKSLATGVPMAGILFPVTQVGTIILPLMVFHQIQLLVCAYLAGRYARDLPASDDGQTSSARSTTLPHAEEPSAT